ncbi:MAG: PIN domain-containing protein [Actinomycetota bacterium]
MVATSGLRVADTSAWHAARNPSVIPAWERALRDSTVAICSQVELEILFSAQSESDYVGLAQDLATLPHVPCGEEAFWRALEVQQLLAHSGALHHRSVKIADLIIAAAAEHAGRSVWHYDEDFDRIARLTGQATEWIAPRGSL